MLYLIQVVGNYFGNKRRYEPVEGEVIYWGGGRISAPPAIPPCGFDGSGCVAGETLRMLTLVQSVAEKHPSRIYRNFAKK